MRNTTARLHFKVMHCQPHVRLAYLEGLIYKSFRAGKNDKSKRLKRIAIEYL